MNPLLSKQIETLELELLQPEVRKSGKRFDELLADDFVEFGMAGKIFNKEYFVKTVPTLKSEEHEKYEATDFEAKEIAPNTVLLTYKASVENTKTGVKFWTLRCSLWQKSGDSWKIIFHQGTPIK